MHANSTTIDSHGNYNYNLSYICMHDLYVLWHVSVDCSYTSKISFGM